MRAIHFGAILAAIAVVTLLGSPAAAQWRNDRSAGAHSEGYRDGARDGGDDARRGRPYAYERHRAYRDADAGYQPSDGRRDAYQRQYRAGFVAGYRDGYYAGGGRGQRRRGRAGSWQAADRFPPATVTS